MIGSNYLQIVQCSGHFPALHCVQTLWCWRSSVQDSWLSLVPMSRWYFWLTAHQHRDGTLCWTFPHTYSCCEFQSVGLWYCLPTVDCSRRHELWTKKCQYGCNEASMYRNLIQTTTLLRVCSQLENLVTSVQKLTDYSCSHAYFLLSCGCKQRKETK